MSTKQPLRNDKPLPQDDFDTNFDFDFTEHGTGKRDPGSPLKRGVKDALKNHFTRPENFREYVGKVMPRQYGELADDYTQVTDAVRDASDSIRRQARQPIHELAKNLRNKVDPKHKRIHNWLNKTVEATQEFKADPRAVEKMRDNATQLAIQQAFSGYQQEQQEDNQAREEIEGDRFARQFVKMQSQEKLLGMIAKSSDHQIRYITGVDLPYRKKSLELQYRVAHGIADLVTLNRGLVEQQRRQLDILIKNSALPEVQKQQLSENFKQNLRNKFVDTTLGGFGGGKGLLGSFTKNLADSVKQGVEMALTGVDMANMTMESDDPFDSSPEERKRRFASMLAGGFLNQAGPAAAGGVSRWAMRKNPKLTRKVFSGAKKIGYVRNNAHSLLQQYANGDVSGKDAGLRDLVGMMLPTRDKDMTVNRASGRRLIEGTHFDHATRRSVVEVIPGLLGRILQELQITRTGDETIKPLSYNFAKSTFETQSQGTQILRKSVAASSKKDGLEEIMGDIERSGAKLTPEQKEELSKTLIASRRSGRTMTPNSLMSERFFTSGKDGVNAENAAAYSKAFRTYFDGNDRGRFTNSRKGLSTRNKFFEKLADTDADTTNVRALIQDLFDAGQGELVYAAGLMKPDGTINEKALYDGLAGGDLPAGATDTTVPSGRGRRGRIQPPTRFVQQMPMAPVAQPTPRASEAAVAPRSDDRQIRLLEAQRDVMSQFYERNHVDLMEVMEALARVGHGSGTGQGPTSAAASGRTGGGWWGKVSDRMSGMFSRNTGTPETEEAPAKWKGFWNSSLKDNFGRMRDRAATATRFGAKWFGKGAGAAGVAVGAAGGFAADKLSKSRIVGARYLQDFKDGIPRIGDLYVQGQEKVRITAAMLEAGEIHDSEGRIILSLADLADSVGDLKDKAGNVVMTQAERMRSYVRANGEVLTRVWADRIKRGAARGRDAGLFAGSKLLQGARTGFNLGNKGRQIATAFGRELFLPPKDVYVSGEKEPRLYAFKMRAGFYVNVMDNSVITRPTQIKGPVRDGDDNIVINEQDFQRGLVDAEGKPIRTLIQKLATGLRDNAVRTQKLVRNVVRGATRGLQTAGRFASTFLTRGLDGIRAGTWKRSPSEGGGSGVGDVETITVLHQIRDILDERLPGSGGRSWTGPSPQTEQRNINEPQEAPEASTGSTSTNVMGSLGAGLGSLAGGAIKGLAALTRRGRRAWGNSMGQGDAPEAATDETKPKEDPKAEVKKERRLAKRLSSLWRRGPKVQDAPPGVRKKGDSDGNGMRDNSAEEIRANYKNINLPTKTLDDVKQAQSYERKNTIDAITGAIMSGFKSLGGMLGGAADLLTGKGAGRAAGKAAGGLARGAGRAAGWLGRGAAAAGGAVARVGGGFLGRGLAGAGGRMAMLRGAGSMLGKVAGFAGKRILMPVLGAAAATLGAPAIGTALAIGGAIWTAKEVYDYFSEKKDPIEKSDRRMLQLVRMAEYGAPMKDYGAHNKMLKMETFLEDAIKISGGKTELDKNHVDGDTLLSIAEISPSSDHKVSQFLDWFNQRFVPVYLKWMTVAKAAGKSLPGLEDMTAEDRLKVLKATANSDGWDVRVNPFGSENLQIGAKEINFLRDATMQDLEKKQPKDKNGQVIKEAIAPKDAPRAVLDSVKRQVDGGGSAEMQNFRDKVAPAIIQGASTKRFATFTSEGAKRVQTTGLTALQSLRMRMYGFAEPNFADVYAIRCLEDAVKPHVKPDDAGRGSFNGDLTEIYASTAKFFALSPSDAASETRWGLWFQRRFLPVFTTLIGQMNQQAGVTSEDNLERQVDATRLYAIAQGIAGVPGVWEYDAMPRANMAANVDSKSVEVILNNLKAEADKQKVDEAATKPAPQTQEQRSTSSLNSTQVPTRSYASNEQMQTVKMAANSSQFKMPNTMPDVETEPRGSGGSQPGVKPPPQLGSVVHAPGELASGNNGMQYVKAPNAQAIEGLNPEVKRLFLAMAEEYGDLTKQSIQVNRGFVTKQEQAEQYSRTPGKAAPPGSSLHEFGLALDINSVDANRLEKLGLMRKYGFTRPVGGETWHIEPAGIQHDVRGMRSDPGAAAQAVAAGVGQGGGGVGSTKTGFRLGGRDTEYALKVRGASSQEVKTAATGGFAGSVETQRSGAEAIKTAAVNQGGGDLSRSSGGLGGAPAANQSLYASLPQAETKDDAKALVQQTAQSMGIDPKLAMTTVAMESGFRGDAKAGTSSATGLYQFTKGTWSDMMKKHAKDYGIPADTSADDKRANAIMGVKYLEENLSKAKSSGLPEDITSAYMMHFMGPQGGRKALGLQDNAIMADVFPSQASANKTMFYNEDGSPRSKAQFLEHVNNKINKAAKDFGISDNMVASAGPAANQPMFSNRPAPRQALDSSRAPAPPVNSFQLQGVRDRSMSTGPANNQSESALLTVMREGHGVLEQQLDTQKKILEQVSKTADGVTKLAEQILQSAQATASQPSAPAAAPTSRAERSLRQVSSPMYKTA